MLAKPQIVGLYALAAIFLAINYSVAAESGQVRDLIELTNLAGPVTYIFDPGKVTAVDVEHQIQLPRNRKIPVRTGPLETNVWGIVKGPIPISEKNTAFIDRLKLKDKFVQFTVTNDTELWVKASAVSLLRERIAHIDGSKGQCHIAVGAAEWTINEDCPSAKKTINDARQSQDK